MCAGLYFYQLLKTALPESQGDAGNRTGSGPFLPPQSNKLKGLLSGLLLILSLMSEVDQNLV